MMNTKALAVLAATGLLLTFAFQAHAQKKKELVKENFILSCRLDSLQKEYNDLKTEYDATIKKAEEEKAARAVKPRGIDWSFGTDMKDGKSVWQIQEEVSEDPDSDIQGEDVELGSFKPAASDAEYIERLKKMDCILTFPYNENVKKYMLLWGEKYTSRTSRILGLCSYYMPAFQETFNYYGVPEELTVLAVIESAMNPYAVSRAGARGMWQFMYPAAKSHGLRINSYVDERQDPYKEADAAARLLLKEYKRYGDWNLAMSAYNCGAGNVNKAIARAGGKTDYWSIWEYLPNGTRNYVPAFVGALYAITYYKECGITPQPVAMPAQVDTFEIHKMLSFKQVNELVGVPMDDLHMLNPQYLHDVIPGSSDETYILRIPEAYTESFIAHEDSVYTYKSTEYLNPQVIESTVQASPASKSGRSNNSGGGTITYTVKKGDTLGGIAAKHHTTVANLKKWNKLKSDRINIGQTLKINK